jgi:hypothetical protein
VYGHAWSIASLLAAIGDGIEDSLWTAIRSLEEGQLLMYRLAYHVRAYHDAQEPDRLVERADEAKPQRKGPPQADDGEGAAAGRHCERTARAFRSVMDETRQSLESASRKLARSQEIVERARMQLLRLSALSRRIGVRVERADQLATATAERPESAEQPESGATAGTATSSRTS